ncbi:DPY30 domain-containing protein 1-like [Tiliqua scincoides]|uniref:DPY30 domain-containing protein 1-like n=1 Tax=Tiliqua scincoides TaxID=71010 RepID=UPI0034636EF2
MQVAKGRTFYWDSGVVAGTQFFFLTDQQFCDLNRSESGERAWYKMSVDVEYLKNCVGRCLVEGLAVVADCRPVDPVNFLAHWIYRYKEKLNEEEKRKKERAQLEREQEGALVELERLEKLKAEERLIAQKFAEQQKKETKETDVNNPEENEKIESKQEALEDAQDQSDLNVMKNKLNEMPGEVHTVITFEEAPGETVVDQDLHQIPKAMIDDAEEITENEDDTESEDDTPDEDYKSSHPDLNFK